MYRKDTNPHLVIYYIRSYISLIRLAKKKKKIELPSIDGGVVIGITSIKGNFTGVSKNNKCIYSILHRGSKGIPENPLLWLH